MTRAEWRKALKIALFLNDMTERDLAKEMGCTREYIWMLSTGRRNSIRMGVKISERMGIECFDE